MCEPLQLCVTVFCIYTSITPVPRPGALPFCVAWVKQHEGTMLAPEAWGKNLVPLSRRPLMLILQ